MTTSKDNTVHSAAETLSAVASFAGLDAMTWLADKFNLAGRIHRRDAEFAEVFIGFLGVLCASAVNH